jgi:hypothetical protein
MPTPFVVRQLRESTLRPDRRVSRAEGAALYGKLRGVLGDAGAKVGGTAADGPMLRVVAEAAAMSHRVGVLPRGEQRLELGSQGFQVGSHEDGIGIPVVRLD